MIPTSGVCNLLFTINIQSFGTGVLDYNSRLLYIQGGGNFYTINVDTGEESSVSAPYLGILTINPVTGDLFVVQDNTTTDEVWVSYFWPKNMSTSSIYQFAQPLPTTLATSAVIDPSANNIVLQTGVIDNYFNYALNLDGLSDPSPVSTPYNAYFAVTAPMK